MYAIVAPYEYRGQKEMIAWAFIPPWVVMNEFNKDYWYRFETLEEAEAESQFIPIDTEFEWYIKKVG